MVGFPLFQLIEHQVHGVFELLIVLPDLHAVDHLDEGGKVLFLHRGFVVDVADQRAVQKRLCLDPEIIPGLALALGVGDQRCHQLQDVLFAMDIAEGVIVHRLLEVDGVQHLDLVWLIHDFAVFVLHRLAVLAQLGRTPLEHFAALHQDGALGIGNDVGAVHLHQIRLEPEAGLAGTAAADDQHVLVAGILGVLGAAGHGKALGLGQNDVILEHRVDVGGNILMGAPTGRTILHVVAVLLGVLAFQVHRQPQASAAAKPHQKIQRVQAGPPAPQRHRQGGEEREHLSRGIRAGRQPPGFP